MDGRGPEVAMDNFVIGNIKTRRSVRSFETRPVSKELIERIVEAGRFAPSALNRQPWKFIIIDKHELIKELSLIAQERLKKLYKLIPLLKIFVKAFKDQRVVNAVKKTAMSNDDTVFYNAPVVICVANDTRLTGSIHDCYLAAHNMTLAAHSLGIASCFIGRGKAIPKKTLAKKLGVSDCYDFNVFVALGYTKDFPKTPPARKQDTVKWV